MSAFEMPIEIHADDIDEMQHVNNVVYLRWVQDVAIAHWMDRASAALRATFAWVAARHEIDYKQAARLGDAITARTWVGTIDSRRFERHTTITRTADGRLLAQARTLWILIDRATGRITRITPELLACFPPGQSDDSIRA